MAKRWFTGDQHFGHEGIIISCNRPFRNSQKMDQTIITRYKSVVQDEDTVYFLGDLTMKGPQHKGYLEFIISQLPGRKIFIFGSHDEFDPFTYIRVGFESAHTALEVPPYILCHDPAVAILKPNVVWITAHVHTLFKRVANVINVGVDQWGFYPVSEEEIRKEAEKIGLETS